ncbi:MAG: hypothetical protein AB7O48_14875 [Cyclobacteriaceae bacterium]
MNRIVFTAIICFLLSSTKLSAQYMVDDAIKLALLNPVLVPDSNALIFPVANSQEAARILANYSGGGTYNQVQAHFSNNPFIRLPAINLQAEQSSTTAGTMTSIAGLNVTTIADGITQFLVERANEEINILFFQRFKEFLEKKENEDFVQLFPTTKDFIVSTEPFQYPYLMQAFKEAFRKDIANLPVSIHTLLESERFKKLFEKYPEVELGVKALTVVSSLSSGTHPADVLADLGDFKNPKLNDNVYSSLKLAAILAQSVRSREEGIAWVDPDRVLVNIFSNTLERNIFLGLIYAQSENIQFQTKAGPKTFQQALKDFRNSETKMMQIVNYYRELHTNFSATASKLNAIQDKKGKGETVGYETYHSFFVSSITFIEEVTKVTNLLHQFGIDYDKTWYDNQTTQYLKLLRTGADIYKYVNEKNYSAAVVAALLAYSDLAGKDRATTERDMLIKYVENTSANNPVDIEAQRIMDILKLPEWGDLSSKEKKKELCDSIDKYFKQLLSEINITPGLKEQILKYGTFMAAIAQAESADEVKAIMKSVALPPGSSLIKAESKFNITVNGYVGFSYGQEVNHEKAMIAGAHLPVGVALSGSTSAKAIGALSLFLSVVDLGAIATYRHSTDDGSVNLDPLPELTFQNILAPGAYLVLGRLGNTPLAFNMGAQLGPALRKIQSDPNSGQPSATIQSSDLRWNIGLTVDIPLFNLYTKPK